MIFTEAMEAMQYDGKKVCRECWKDGTYLYIPSNKKCIMLSKLNSEGERRNFFVREISASNIMAEDWRLFDE